MGYMPYFRAGAAAYGAYTNSRRGPSTAYGATQNSTYTAVRTRRRRRIGGKYQSFKTKLMASTPAKHVMTGDSSTSVVGGTHNTMYTCNLTAGIVAGTGDNQRVGDAVQLLSLKINALISTNAALTAAGMYRVIVGWSGEEYNLPNQLSAAGLVSSEVFQATTGAAWRNTSIVNPKAFTVLDDRIWSLNNSIANVAEIQEISYTVPCSTNFSFQAAGSALGKTRNLYLIFIPCIFGGAAGTTVAGNIALSTDLVYKQI